MEDSSVSGPYDFAELVELLGRPSAEGNVELPVIEDGVAKYFMRSIQELIGKPPPPRGPGIPRWFYWDCLGGRGAGCRAVAGAFSSDQDACYMLTRCEKHIAVLRRRE